MKRFNLDNYEFDKDYLLQFFDRETESLKNILNDTYQKIPYVSDDYRIYYEDVVREVLDIWGL